MDRNNLTKFTVLSCEKETQQIRYRQKLPQQNKASIVCPQLTSYSMLKSCKRLL